MTQELPQWVWKFVEHTFGIYSAYLYLNFLMWTIATSEDASIWARLCQLALLQLPLKAELREAVQVSWRGVLRVQIPQFLYFVKCYRVVQCLHLIELVSCCIWHHEISRFVLTGINSVFLFNSIENCFLTINYSWFSLFMIDTFYKVSTNTELVNAKWLPLGKCRFSFLQTSDHIFINWSVSNNC